MSLELLELSMFILDENSLFILKLCLSIGNITKSTLLHECVVSHLTAVPWKKFLNSSASLQLNQLKSRKKWKK